MCRLFPGVHGRLTDLCQLTQRKYSLAVTVAFGKLFDAVAVDTEATAKSCIEVKEGLTRGTGGSCVGAAPTALILCLSLHRCLNMSQCAHM